MRKILLLAISVCSISFTSVYGQNNSVIEGDSRSMDTLSYCVGTDVGQNVKHQFEGQDVDIEELKNGLRGAFTNKSYISTNEANAVLERFFGAVTERKAAFQKEHEKNPTALFKVFANSAESKKIAYAMGVAMGANIINSSLNIHYYWLLKGVGDAYNGGGQLKPEQISAFMNNYFNVVLPAEVKRRSEEWLEKKSRESGVVKSESGLLYRVVSAGDMEKAAKNDGYTVVVHYEGRLQNGKVFDSSRSREKPVEFPLDRVIKGWTEGMKYVGPGGKIILYIPSELAYGAQGAGGTIGPNEALEFEVELIEVKPVETEESASTADGRSITR